MSPQKCSLGYHSLSILFNHYLWCRYSFCNFKKSSSDENQTKLHKSEACVIFCTSGFSCLPRMWIHVWRISPKLLYLSLNTSTLSFALNYIMETQQSNRLKPFYHTIYQTFPKLLLLLNSNLNSENLHNATIMCRLEQAEITRKIHWKARGTMAVQVRTKEDKELSGVRGNYPKYLGHVYEPNQTLESLLISYSDLPFNILQTLLINCSRFYCW